MISIELSRLGLTCTVAVLAMWEYLLLISVSARHDGCPLKSSEQCTNGTFTDLYVSLLFIKVLSFLRLLDYDEFAARVLFSQEVDIWSFGCLIFELLTLQIPYFDSSELQIHESLQVCLTFYYQRKSERWSFTLAS